MSLKDFYIKLYNKMFAFIETLPLDQKAIVQPIFNKVKSPDVLENEQINKKNKRK
jgi:hypothetical protein